MEEHSFDRLLQLTNPRAITCCELTYLRNFPPEKHEKRCDSESRVQTTDIVVNNFGWAKKKSQEWGRSSIRSRHVGIFFQSHQLMCRLKIPAEKFF